MSIVEKFYDPYFAAKMQTWGQWIFSGNMLGYMFQTKYLGKHVRHRVGFKTPRIGNHLASPMCM